MNGFSIYLCIGKYGGWTFGFDGPAFRIVLGWIGFCICLRDIERDVEALLDIIELHEGNKANASR